MSTFGLPPLNALQKTRKTVQFDPEIPGLSKPATGAPFSAVPPPAATNAVAPLGLPSTDAGSTGTTSQLPRPPAASPLAPLVQHATDPALHALQSQYAPVKQGFDAAESTFEHARSTRDNLLGVVKPVVAFNPKLDMTPPHWAGTTPGGATALDTAQRQLADAAAKRDSFVPALQKSTAGFRDYTDRSQANATLKAAGGVPTPIPLPPAVPHTVPARSPAQHGPSEGITNAPGGASAPSLLQPRTIYNDGSGATYRTGEGRLGVLPAGVAVTRQQNGVNAFGATGASVAAATGQSAPSLVAPLGLPSAHPDLSVNLPRPPVADPYQIRQADNQRRQLLSSLDSQTFANSFGVQRGDRRAIEAQGQINATAAGLADQGLKTASDIASGDRNVVAANGLAALDQTGQNQRALLQDQGDTSRLGMHEGGETQRTQLQTLAQLNAPSLTTDTDGNLVRVSGTNATSVRRPDGSLLRTLQTDQSPDGNTIVTAYTAQKKAIDDAAALTGKAPDYSGLDTSVLGQAYRKTLAPLELPRSRTPPPAAIAHLKANPHLASSFDGYFGKGAAARYLKGAGQ